MIRSYKAHCPKCQTTGRFKKLPRKEGDIFARWACTNAGCGNEVHVYGP